MSTPDLNPSVSLTPSRSTAAAPETPMTQPNTVKTPLYRAIAPLHRHPQQSIHPHPFPVRRPNHVSPHQTHQDPSGLVYPGRGLPTRPGGQSPNTVANPAGGPALPVYAYQNGHGLDPMSQFMRAAHPQIPPASHLGSGHLKGVPHFLQPRVAHPPTSILDNGGRKHARSRNDVLVVLIRKRKVRITEGASLYSLCRSWLRNGAHEGVQKQQSNTMTCLPKPLPADMVETSLPKDSVEEPNREEDTEDEDSLKQLSVSDLLKRHVDRAKKVRARLREERLKRIVRYKARLALLLPPLGEQCRNE